MKQWKILIAVLISPFASKIRGVKRWFDFGPISFQPAEFAKY